MTTRNTATVFFQESPNVRGLFSALWQVVVAWIGARRHRALDFRQLPENEITPEMHTRIKAVREASDQDLINI